MLSLFFKAVLRSVSVALKTDVQSPPQVINTTTNIPVFQEVCNVSRDHCNARNLEKKFAILFAWEWLTWQLLTEEAFLISDNGGKDTTKAMLDAETACQDVDMV